MLKSISVSNYVLIKELEIEFNPGFSIITGETGAGKSILLGALSLLVGQRADTSVLLDTSRKCVIEGRFDISRYQLTDFFEANDLEYDQSLIIRREVLDSGRSRAFVNDSPVNLSILKELGDKLIDIHSQHQNLNLYDADFQLNVLDALAANSAIKLQYVQWYKAFRSLDSELKKLLAEEEQNKAELDYINYQFEQLEAAKLQPGELSSLEEEQKALSHASEIKQTLSSSALWLDSDENSLLPAMKEITQQLQKVSGFFPKAQSLYERMQSCYIELKDLTAELSSTADLVDIDPEKLILVSERIDTLYALLQKHRLTNADDLITLRNELAEKISQASSLEDRIKELQKKKQQTFSELTEQATRLTNSRKAQQKRLEDHVVQLLKQLGIPNAQFKAQIIPASGLGVSGADEVQFTFAANSQSPLQDIAKVASGGEMSRVMLAIKNLVSQSLALPTILFDEIDTGVSGDIADKMGQIMKSMSANMQVVSITHLPQVAARGDFHYLVYKIEDHRAAKTSIKLLTNNERVTEIAKMLSGQKITEAALVNARELLGA